MLTTGDDTTQFGDTVGGDATLDLGQLIAPQGLPVTDEEGNPIHFTMQDGSQLQVGKMKFITCWLLFKDIAQGQGR